MRVEYTTYVEPLTPALYKRMGGRTRDDTWNHQN